VECRNKDACKTLNVNGNKNIGIKMWKVEVFKNILTKKIKMQQKELAHIKCKIKKKTHNLMSIEEEKKFQKKEK
jgi:hypothetical protein